MNLYLAFFFYLIALYAIKVKNCVTYYKKKNLDMLLIEQSFIKTIKLKPINFEWLYFFYSLLVFIHGLNYHYNSHFDSKCNASLGSVQDGSKAVLMNIIKNYPKK